MDKEWINGRVLVGRHHEAIIDRRLVAGLPGVFSEVRIRRGWVVDFDSLDDAVRSAEQLIGCSLSEFDPSPVVLSSEVVSDVGSVSAAILDGSVRVPPQFKLRNWHSWLGSEYRDRP